MKTSHYSQIQNNEAQILRCKFNCKINQIEQSCLRKFGLPSYVQFTFKKRFRNARFCATLVNSESHYVFILTEPNICSFDVNKDIWISNKQSNENFSTAQL